MPTDPLDIIVSLSHELGAPEYVLGGGGNASCKDAETLWVKPSGAKLSDVGREDLVALDRRRLARLYSATLPGEPAAREAAVKDLLLAARREDVAGRPSVEAPLHDAFPQTFVVHTHPALVNGMTCAVEGQAACRRLFPKALWLAYCDPGFTLSVALRRALDEGPESRGGPPQVVFLQNHGIIVAGDDADEVRAMHRQAIDALAAAYVGAGVAMEVHVEPRPDGEALSAVIRRLRDVLGGDAAAAVAVSGRFSVPRGPLTPDHIVYAKARPLLGEPTREAVDEYRRRHGHSPRLIACAEGVFGVASDLRSAELALALAFDGARVVQLAAAFGGPHFMDNRAADFVEHWEVERYRREVARHKEDAE